MIGELKLLGAIALSLPTLNKSPFCDRFDLASRSLSRPLWTRTTV